jgi:hypothetical protein
MGSHQCSVDDNFYATINDLFPYDFYFSVRGLWLLLRAVLVGFVDKYIVIYLVLFIDLVSLIFNMWNI